MSIYRPDLGCGHTLIFRDIPPPMIGEQVWCIRCNDYRRVVHAPYACYGKCRSCAYRTQGYTNRGHCKALMKSHQERHPSHTLILVKDGVVLEKWEPLTDSLKDSFQELLTSLGMSVE